MSNFKYIRVKEICEYLGVDCSVVYRKLQQNKLPGAVKFGNTWLVDRQKFMEYIERGGDIPLPKNYGI